MKIKLTIFIFFSLLFNLTTKAVNIDDKYSFSTQEVTRASEALAASTSEVPAPEVSIYSPRNDFSSGKNKPISYEDQKTLIKCIFKKFSSEIIFNQPDFFSIPIYLRNSVFLI